MAEFKIAFENTLGFEDSRRSGEVTCDAGGRTRFGIAEKFHPELPERFFNGPAEAALAEAEKIEERDYWSAMRLDEIPSQEVANKLFDMAVNMGVRQAAVMGQRAANCTPPRATAARAGDPANAARALSSQQSALSRATRPLRSPTPPTSPSSGKDEDVAARTTAEGSSTPACATSAQSGDPGGCATQVPIEEDGIIGPRTLAAINAIDPERYLQVLRSLCAEFYRHVASLHPAEAVDLKGWLRRAEA